MTEITRRKQDLVQRVGIVLIILTIAAAAFMIT